MGMFDYVNHECKCPKCGELVNEFQTKDRGSSMVTLELSQVDNLYGICDKCKTYIKFCRKKGLKDTIKSFSMEYTVHVE